MAQVGGARPAAVEEYLGRLTADLGGTLGVLLTSFGTRHGLWRALAGAGPCTVEQVTSRVTVDRAMLSATIEGFDDFSAVSLGDIPTGGTHLAKPVAMHHRLGAAGWERVSQR